MSKKGQKNLRGKPEKWDELKKRVMLSLTSTGADGLDAIATTLGLNRSELVERIGRGLIPIHSETSNDFDNNRTDYSYESIERQSLAGEML